MKNSELNNFYAGLSSVAQLKGAVLAFAVGKNLHEVHKSINELQSKLVVDEGFKKFEEAKLALLSDLAIKDEQGNPKQKQVPGGMTFEFEDDSEVEAVLAALEEEHAAGIDAQKTNKDDHDKLMGIEWEGKKKMVKYSDLPSDITGAQVSAILKMVTEEN